MDIVLADYRDRRLWDAYVLNHPEGSAYQLFAWRDAVTEAYGFDGRYLMAREGGRVLGVLPLIDYRRPFLPRRLISLPYCDFGGVLANDAVVAGRLLKEARHLLDRLPAAALEVRSTSSEELEDAGGKVRMLLELPAGSEVLLRGMKAKLRSQINKPQRDGLIAKLGGTELLEDFYEVFAANMRDLGSPVHSPTWFSRILQGYGGRARVGVVETPNGEPAAAGIVLMGGNTVAIPWASSRRSLNHLNPNMLLYWTFLALAADLGYRWFDFGRSTPGTGTYRFKQQWGARPQVLKWVNYDAAGVCHNIRPATGGLRSKVESLWRHLPLSCCNTLGPVIRRHVSL